jgi:hypothetical protein
MKYLLFVLLIITILPACEFKNEEELESTQCDTTNVTYAKIKPIFDRNCVRCHNDQTNYLGVKLNTYNNAKDAVQAGIVPAVNHIPTPGIVPMPFQLPKLEDCNVKKITNWANNNTPE